MNFLKAVTFSVALGCFWVVWLTPKGSVPFCLGLAFFGAALYLGGLIQGGEAVQRALDEQSGDL